MDNKHINHKGSEKNKKNSMIVNLTTMNISYLILHSEFSEL